MFIFIVGDFWKAVKDTKKVNVKTVKYYRLLTSGGGIVFTGYNGSTDKSKPGNVRRYKNNYNSAASHFCFSSRRYPDVGLDEMANVG